MRRFAEQMGWAADKGGFAIDAAVNERLGFLRKTYGLLTLQVLLVGALSALLMQNEELLQKVTGLMFGSFWVYLGIMFAVSLVTRSMLKGNKPMGVQIAAAGIWVVFLTCLVAPISYMAKEKTGSYAILGEAFILTLCIFGGLTAYVLTTKKDFSAIGGAIWIASWSLIGLAVVLALTGNSGGIWYSLLWIALLGAWVLYDTSQVLHHRQVGQHVAASVDLLVDFVYMFIHILMVLMNRD